MALVCLCERVNDRSIGRALRAGADSVEAVGEVCGAGTRCGGCRPTIESMLAASEEGTTLRLVSIRRPERQAS